MPGNSKCHHRFEPFLEILEEKEWTFSFLVMAKFVHVKN